MTAGQLRERIAFEDPGEGVDSNGDPITDEAGNAVGEWTERYRCDAGIIFLRGGEPVLAERLTGQRPSIITVRACDDARQVTTAWRVRDLRKDRLFNIRSITPDPENSYIDFLCEDGVAT